MKRTIEDEGAVDALPKRRLQDMQVQPKIKLHIPGAWPEDASNDDDDDDEYTFIFSSHPASPQRAFPASSPKPQKSSALRSPFRTFTIGALLQILNPLRIFKTPVAPSQRQQKHAQEVQQIQENPATDVFFQTPQQSPVAERKHVQTPTQPSIAAERAQDVPTRQRRDSFGHNFVVPPSLSLTPVKRQEDLPRSYVGEHNRQLHHRKHNIPFGVGSAGFDPQTLIPTPVRTRALRTPHSARRWSPYHYEHGVTRKKHSILRSAKPTYKPFEASLTIPSPQQYIEEEISPVDEEGDLGMFDVDVPLRKRTLRIAPESYSHLTSERIDSVHGVAKYFRSELGINEKYGPAFEHYRDAAPEFDPDQSFEDSPKPAGFDLEQTKSPTAEYKPVIRDEDQIYGGIERWYKKVQSRDAKTEAAMSPSMKLRYAVVHREQIMAESRARIAESRLIFAERKKQREAEELQARELQQKKQREADLLKELADAEAAKAAAIMWEEKRAMEVAVEDQRIDDRKIPHKDWNNKLPIYNKVDEGLMVEEPGKILIERPQLTRHDLGTLIPMNFGDAESGWLNDSVVMAALEHLVKAANKQCGHDMMQREKPAPYWVFNSNWYTMVGNGSGITRWAGKRGVNLNGKKLLEARKILFPVCTGSHWTIAILDPRQRFIEVLNSMDRSEKSHYNREIAQRALSWVRHELGKDFLAVEWQSVPSHTRLQKNACDCGVFTIMNAIARVSGVETWAMREQLTHENMGKFRGFIAGMLFNGGFETAGPFRLIVKDRLWEGALGEDPQYFKVPGGVEEYY